eukprot:14826027-Alexandrium_andersonii.AAC.1
MGRCAVVVMVSHTSPPACSQGSLAGNLGCPHGELWTSEPTRGDPAANCGAPQGTMGQPTGPPH